MKNPEYVSPSVAAYPAAIALPWVAAMSFAPGPQIWWLAGAFALSLFCLLICGMFLVQAATAYSWVQQPELTLKNFSKDYFFRPVFRVFRFIAVGLIYTSATIAVLACGEWIVLFTAMLAVLTANVVVILTVLSAEAWAATRARYALAMMGYKRQPVETPDAPTVH